MGPATRAVVATAALLAPAAGATWLGVRVLTDNPGVPERRADLLATFLDGEHVRLEGDRARDTGTWGVHVDDGYVRVEAVLEAQGRTAVRRYRVLDGVVPDGPTHVRLSPYAWPDDPQVLARRTGSRLDIVAARAGGHVLPLWRLTPPDPHDTWVVAVHGRGSSRTELFRLAEVALGIGHPVLVASYRTDRWTAAPAPLTTLGTVEWRDVEAAVATALAGGARRVVLAGCSLGGALAASTVRHSRLAPWVAGLVLDAPALSWGRLLRDLAHGRRVPTVLVGPVMALARLRARIDWAALDHLDGAHEFDTPVLLFHGSDDDAVPVWLSDAFAAARPDLVTYERVDGATHVTAWNRDPQRYATAVRRFLATQVDA